MSSAWRKYTRTWYSGYAFQAVVVFGTAPILMPLIVSDYYGGDGASRTASVAGIVMAAFFGGQLLSPLMGKLTDRTRWYRAFYVSGYLLLALGLSFFPAANFLWYWCMLALLQGIGAGTTNTVASMFIVEFTPKDEWDPRVSAMQTVYGIGQAAGLGLASVLSGRPEFGMILSGVLMIPGVVIGCIHLPKKRTRTPDQKVTFNHRTHRPPQNVMSLLSGYEAGLRRSLTRFTKQWMSAFGLYILGWFFVMFATWIVGDLFPLLMRDAYKIDPHESTIFYAIGAAIGIFAYVPAGVLAKRIGDSRVVMIGVAMTLVADVIMALMAVSIEYGWMGVTYAKYTAAAAYILIPIAWSPLIVGGTAWCARLATFEEGEALGIYNASTAVASVLSACAAGQIASYWNYGGIVIVAAACSAASVVCLIPLVIAKGKEPAAAA